jgi:hypothetical protein
MNTSLTTTEQIILNGRIFWVRQGEKDARRERLSIWIMIASVPATAFCVALFIFAATSGMLK